MTKCPVCGEKGFLLKNVNGFYVNKCVGCELEFVHPMPSDDALSEFYTNYSDFRARVDVTKRNAERNLLSIGNYKELNYQSMILDYGCGENTFVEVCRERDFINSYGYDLFVAKDDGKTISLDPGNKTKWDVISLWGVLEHLVSPIQILKELKEILSDDGIIVLTTVSIESKIPFQYKPPEHMLYFTKKSISTLAEITGLNVLSYSPYVMEQNSGVYLSILLRTMPDRYRDLVTHSLPDFVEVPTNEVIVVLHKK